MPLDPIDLEAEKALLRRSLRESGRQVRPALTLTLTLTLARSLTRTRTITRTRTLILTLTLTLTLTTRQASLRISPYLPYFCPVSPLYLAYISPISPQASLRISGAKRIVQEIMRRYSGNVGEV